VLADQPSGHHHHQHNQKANNQPKERTNEQQ
jgi:hypothetical protein